MVIVRRGSTSLLLCASLAMSCQSDIPSWEHPGQGDARRRALARELDQVIEHEMAAKALSSFAVVVVDRSGVVIARGYGIDPETGVKTTPETIFRIGSVSKLFTAIGAMQLVEEGVLSLDGSVADSLGDPGPENPHQTPITLRHLLTHRSGLPREPRTGHYFDDSEPTLEETVASLRGSRLLFSPGTRFKYSNGGYAAVGLMIERATGQPFAERMASTLFKPLGMARTSFRRSPEIEKHLVRGRMWSYDGLEFAAPLFDLGMAPAGNMYSTAGDLGRFLVALLNGGRGERARILSGATLDRMWAPQPADPTEGLGFTLEELDGERTVSHGGAIYGFVCRLVALPDAGIGVAAMTNRDVSFAVTRRITEHAARWMLAREKRGEASPSMVLTEAMGGSLAEQAAGTWSNGEDRMVFEARGERLYHLGTVFTTEIRRSGDLWFWDDRHMFAPGIRFRDEIEPPILEVDGSTYHRIIPDPEPEPSDWLEILGEYGWDHNMIILFARGGRLSARIEWIFQYPLTEVGEDRYRLPEYSIHDDEILMIERDSVGRVIGVNISGILFPRRSA